MKPTALLMLTALLIVVTPAVSSAQEPGALALIYYWKAKPGQLDSYNRYIREIAEPIDEEAQRRGAFLSVTTFISQKSDGPWTHMRVFVLRDQVQLDALSKALDAAGAALEPDEAKRKARSEYAATLRDFVAQEVVEILHRDSRTAGVSARTPPRSTRASKAGGLSTSMGSATTTRRVPRAT